MSDHGVVAQNRMLALAHIMNAQKDQSARKRRRDEQPPAVEEPSDKRSGKSEHG